MSFKEIFTLTHADVLSSIALLMFLGVFIAITIRVMRTRRDELDHNSNLPLDEGVQAQEQQS